MSRVTPERHSDVARYAGRFLIEPLPVPAFVDEVGEVVASAGVYIVCSRSDECLYVGSARRPGDRFGLVSRLHEHLRKEERRMRWHRAWLVPMSADASLDRVRLVEGMIGTDLGCPANKRLPRILPAGASRGAGS